MTFRKGIKELIKGLLPPLLYNWLAYRSSFKGFSEYAPLLSANKQLKDIHKGKRCFILGSGPSIKNDDLQGLKGEIVFALNNFYVHKDFKEIVKGDTAKYYLTAATHPPQTEEEWKDWFTDMEKNIPLHVNMIFGLSAYKGNIYHLFGKYGLFKSHKKYWYFASRPFNDDKFDYKGTDITRSIFTAEAASVFALIVAIYMGFEEIYLVGMDHDYFLYENESEMRMYKKALHQNNEFAKIFKDEFYIEEFNRQYKIFKKYRALDMHSASKIYNASSGGILKVFPRVKLSEVL